MSRIGKLPVTVPQNVTVTIQEGQVKVKGPKGEISRTHRPEIEYNIEEGQVSVSRKSESKEVRAYHGLERSLLANMIEGVNEGFEKQVQLIGVGYRADVKGDVLNMDLGYSHDINYKLPEGVKASVIKEGRDIYVKFEGVDKQRVSQTAAEVRAFRPPEPYKGKGVRYRGEHVARKAGKSGKK